MAAANLTPDEMEIEIGEKLKALRLSLNLEQKTLAERAGISVRALRNLEGGCGATLRTLVCTVRALGRTEWLHSVGPAIESVQAVTRYTAPRQRASSQRVTKPQV